MRTPQIFPCHSHRRSPSAFRELCVHRGYRAKEADYYSYRKSDPLYNQFSSMISQTELTLIAKKSLTCQLKEQNLQQQRYFFINIKMILINSAQNILLKLYHIYR